MNHTRHDDRYAPLSAALDGEAADPETVDALLGDDEGRRVLAEFVRLRAYLRAAAGEPPEEIRRPAAGAPPGSARGRWRSALAAAVAAVALGLALWATLADRGRPAPEPAIGEVGAPPPPDRVLRFQPGIDWFQGDLPASRPPASDVPASGASDGGRR